MNFLTPLEKKVILFFMTMLALGSTIIILKKYTPYHIADELILENQPKQATQQRELKPYPLKVDSQPEREIISRPAPAKKKGSPKPSPEHQQNRVAKEKLEEPQIEKENEKSKKEEPVEKDKVLDYINNADINGLMELPGIGKVLAQRIMEYRKNYGNFKSVDELKNVPGIGEKKLEAIKSAF